MGTFTKNADGLNQHYGTRSADYLARATETNKVTLNIIGEDLIDAITSDAQKAQWVRGAVLPSGALITSAKLFVTETFASASTTGTLDIGTYNADTGAAINDDGIDAAVAIASVLATAGELVTCDGAQVASAAGGTALTAAGIIVATWDTQAFTAGAARLEVEYIIPQNS